MKQTRIGDRFIVFGRTAPANVKTDHAQPTQQRAKVRRIVVIKDGELVGGTPGR